VPAADALRSIERERVKRQQLGRLSRLTLMRRGTEAMGPTDKVGSAGVDRNELEHATILARQGEIDSAIGLLERRLAADRNDRAARNMLADLYERKADDALASRDTASAIALLEKSLRLDPNDAQVAERLKQLRAAAASKPTEAKSR
jgi:tetratricopeptide (TPR) repeat protein